MTVNQPNFNINAETAGIASTKFDNLSDEELRKLINASGAVLTGRPGKVGPVKAPPPPKKMVNLESILGGLYVD